MIISDEAESFMHQPRSEGESQLEETGVNESEKSSNRNIKFPTFPKPCTWSIMTSCKAPLEKSFGECRVGKTFDEGLTCIGSTVAAQQQSLPKCIPCAYKLTMTLSNKVMKPLE